MLGRLLVAETTVTLRIAGGGQPAVEIPVTISQNAEADGDLLASAWAARRVRELGVTADRHEDELLALGRRYGVVSAATSLLVLETLEQYLEHDVAPPANRGDMLAKWQAAKDAAAKQVQSTERNHVDTVVGLWQTRVAWWQQKHTVPAGWRVDAQPQGGAATRAVGGQVAELEADRDGSALMPEAPAPSSEASRRERGRGEAGAMNRMAQSAVQLEESATAMAADDAAVPGATAGGASGASMRVAAWTPDTPYLRAIQAVPAKQAYAAYLAQRGAYASSPSFYLDCADYLFRIGQTDEARRVLSNLGELGIDDGALLRVWAWRLAQADDLDQAIHILDYVRKLRPEEAQSHRSLALLMVDRYRRDGNPVDAQHAVDGLWRVISVADQRFPEIGVIAATELNQLLASIERAQHQSDVNTAMVDQRLKQLLDYDIRIVLSWDADLTDVDLHVTEPTAERAYYGHRQTRSGGWVSRDCTQGYGPETYTIRHALPGDYQITAHYYGSRQQDLIGPATVTATVILDYGRPSERRQVVTLRLDKPSQTVPFATLTIGDDGPVLAPVK